MSFWKITKRKRKSYRTRCLAVSKEVRARVAKRQEIEGVPCCIISGLSDSLEAAHYIPRSQGGLGIERNIVLLNHDIHYAFDHGDKREEYGKRIREYLQSQYPDWNEDDLYYQKYPKEMQV